MRQAVLAAAVLAWASARVPAMVSEPAMVSVLARVLAWAQVLASARVLAPAWDPALASALVSDWASALAKIPTSST